MTDGTPGQPTGKSKHVELTLDQLVELQPGLGRLMPEIGRRYWILYYAAKGGNWELADYQRRQLLHLLKMGATLRPKHEKNLNAYASGTLGPIEQAIQARDWAAFDKAFQAGIESANKFHTITGHSEIRWQLPDEPPKDFDLGPSKE